MSFPFYVARRYLFSRKKNNAINIISGISVGGITLATAAMVCVLSGFNGFRDLIGSLFTTFDPQIEIVPAKGKFAAMDDPALTAVSKNPDVAAVSGCIEDNALILFRGRPTVITIKGVDDGYKNSTDILSILYGEGDYKFERAGVHFGIPGYGLAQQMGGPDFGTIQICVPRKGEKINLTNPIENINVDDITATGLCFQVHQGKYDNGMMLSSLSFAQRLFEQEGNITQLEVKLKAGVSEDKVKAELKKLVGDRYDVRDRYEQQEDTFNVMKIEKVFAFFFLSFIVLVACFNIIGSLSMLIIDKREDVSTLRSLGATDSEIIKIFLYEGRLITLVGAVAGVVIGLVLCLCQQQFGLLKLGGGSDNFIVSAYPVSIHFLDILIVLFIVILVGFISVWYPVRYLSKQLL
ncbi:MAG: FtsX-like permease family protein [Alloprevotella sp.]|nr:FtsX-like permease family protein [Prevotella sp.]MBR1712774.1 FtsX-like permease family protein [Alloprevotella sp.]